MPLRIAQTGDIHLEQDRYFTDTAQCLEWFVEDAIRANTNLFVVNGDLTTYKQTIQERNLWVDTLIQMGNHAPVVLVAGNHGKELDGDLHLTYAHDQRFERGFGSADAARGGVVQVDFLLSSLPLIVRSRQSSG